MNCFLFFSHEITIYSLYLYELFLNFFSFEILKSQTLFFNFHGLVGSARVTRLLNRVNSRVVFSLYLTL